ncbi:MAG: hypothetical protein JO287_20385 [Pseudonocardiales bacterium]|nr:hypothetical protein [Pseudonocardiales bacterium]
MPVSLAVSGLGSYHVITPSPRGRYDWPWRGGASFVTPNGSQVLLRGTALDVSRPWSCDFVALVRGARRSFTVAEAGAFDWHSTYTTIPDRLLHQPYRGGELIIGIRDRAEPPDYRAAWRGQWFELHTRASGAPEGISTIFDAFRLTDTPLGMLVQPRSTGQVQAEPVRVAKEVPGIGYLMIERPGASQVAVPDFRGHPTLHGELWRQPLGPGAQGRSRPDTLVLATPTAVTRLVPGPADTSDLSRVLAFLHELNVTWESL